MKQIFDFDGALKDLFQQDGTSFLIRLTGGVSIREFLNVELPRVQQRRVDLVLSLADGTILHIEIQSTHDRDMPFRMLMYYALLKRKYRRPVRQVVLYVGSAPVHMARGIRADKVSFEYEIVDIREIDARDLMTSGNPADLALAVLCDGGDKRLAEIVKLACALREPVRQRVLAQILVLSGLRALSGKVEWELRNMGAVIDINKNPVLLRWQNEAIARGKVAGKVELLRDQLTSRFGALPEWAQDRLSRATPTQLQRWGLKVATAATLEGVLGKK